MYDKYFIVDLYFIHRHVHTLTISALFVMFILFPVSICLLSFLSVVLTTLALKMGVKKVLTIYVFDRRFPSNESAILSVHSSPISNDSNRILHLYSST